MELPSFYRTFAKNILRQSVDYLPQDQNSFKPSKFCLLLLLITLLASSLVQATGIYSHLQLKQDVTHFLAERYKQVPHERIDINVGNLDNRLHLSLCSVPVEFTPQDQTGLGGNISVKADCPGTINWTIHIPARVSIYREIPVALKDLPRGQIIANGHLGTALVNISTIRQGFAADAQAILGRETKRNIGKGEVFRTALLDSPTAVKRGETVVLESVSGSIKVSSSGTAMGDGRLGQKIRVKNESSDRIITGIVKSQGLVQTL